MEGEKENKRSGLDTFLIGVHVAGRDVVLAKSNTEGNAKAKLYCLSSQPSIDENEKEKEVQRQRKMGGHQYISHL